MFSQWLAACCPGRTNYDQQKYDKRSWSHGNYPLIEGKTLYNETGHSIANNSDCEWAATQKRPARGMKTVAWTAALNWTSARAGSIPLLGQVRHLAGREALELWNVAREIPQV